MGVVALQTTIFAQFISTKPFHFWVGFIKFTAHKNFTPYDMLLHKYSMYVCINVYFICIFTGMMLGAYIIFVCIYRYDATQSKYVYFNCMYFNTMQGKYRIYIYSFICMCIQGRYVCIYCMYFNV